MKLLKIILINLFVIIAVFIIIDYMIVCVQFYQPYYAEGFDIAGRLENNIDYDINKKSIITMGCSFTYGENIDQEETLSYKLQQLTKRKVYNTGRTSWGPQFILRDIQKGDFFNKLEIVPPEYVIYTFISDHIRRIYTDYFTTTENTIYDLYEIKNDKLILRPPKVRPVNYLQITMAGKRLNWLLYCNTSNDKKFDRLKLYIFAMQEELSKRYPGVKMAVVVYHPEANSQQHNITPFRTERWGELEEKGIQVIRFDTPEYDFLMNYEYLAYDAAHPSGKAWDTLTPIIIDKLNLTEE